MHLRLGLCPSIVRRPHATCACAQEDAGNTVAPGAISWSGLVPAQEDTSNTVASELLKWKRARLVKASACAEKKKNSCTSLVHCKNIYFVISRKVLFRWSPVTLRILRRNPLVGKGVIF